MSYISGLLPYGATDDQVQEILTKAGLDITLEKLIGYDKDEFSGYRKSANFSKHQQNILYTVRNKVLMRHKHQHKYGRKSEIGSWKLAAKQQRLSLPNLENSVDHENHAETSMSSSKENSTSDISAIKVEDGIVDESRKTRSHRQIHNISKVTEEKPLPKKKVTTPPTTKNSTPPKIPSNLRTFEELQEVLKEHSIDFEVEHLKPMSTSMFREFLIYGGFSQVQQEILKQVKTQLTGLKLDEKTVKKASPKTKSAPKKSILLTKFNLNPKFTEEEAKTHLEALGLSVDFSELMNMSKLQFKQWKEVNCVNSKQGNMIGYIRKKLKDRIYARTYKRDVKETSQSSTTIEESITTETESSKTPSKCPLKSSIKNASKSHLTTTPKSKFNLPDAFTREQAQEKIESLGIAAKLDEIMAMNREEFITYKSEKGLNLKQSTTLSFIRDTLKKRENAKRFSVKRNMLRRQKRLREGKKPRSSKIAIMQEADKPGPSQGVPKIDRCPREEVKVEPELQEYSDPSDDDEEEYLETPTSKMTKAQKNKLLVKKYNLPERFTETEAQKHLVSIGIKAHLDEISKMGKDEFIKFKLNNKFNMKQRTTLSYMRKKLRARYYNRQYKVSKNVQKEGVPSAPLKKTTFGLRKPAKKFVQLGIPSYLSQEEIQEHLFTIGIDLQISQLMAMNSDAFKKYKQENEFSITQKRTLSCVREKLKKRMWMKNYHETVRKWQGNRAPVLPHKEDSVPNSSEPNSSEAASIKEDSSEPKMVPSPNSDEKYLCWSNEDAFLDEKWEPHEETLPKNDEADEEEKDELTLGDPHCKKDPPQDLPNTSSNSDRPSRQAKDNALRRFSDKEFLASISKTGLEDSDEEFPDIKVCSSRLIRQSRASQESVEDPTLREESTMKFNDESEINQELQDLGINVTLAEIVAMAKTKFWEFRKQSGFSGEQQEFLKVLRKRMMARLASKRYREKKMVKTHEKTKIRCLDKARSPEVDEKMDIFQDHNITTDPGRQTENPLERLEKVEKDVEHEKISKETPKESQEPVPKPQEKAISNKREAKEAIQPIPNVVVPKKPKLDQESSDIQKPDSKIASPIPADLDPVVQCLLSLSSSCSSEPPTPEDVSPCFVTITLNYAKIKSFSKESISYPGHIFTFIYKSSLPNRRGEDPIEVYECNTCILTASEYKSAEARKYVMDTLKTVKVLNGKVVDSDYDGIGHVCVPIELMRKRYNLDEEGQKIE